MAFVRYASLAIALSAGITLAAPLEAQTTATLNISARVVEECTVRSKRELVKLARKLNDPGLIRRCSQGVQSRVDQQVVKGANLQPLSAVPTRLSKQRVSRLTLAGKADVVLVTVTY